MLRRIYRALFARRATWVLEKEVGANEPANFRFTIYDPGPGEVASAFDEHVRPMLQDGWTLVSAPKPEKPCSSN